jgi:hypothetical protein
MDSHPPVRAVGLGKMVAQRGFAANGNGASDPYQGTTSVVPTIMAGIKGFSPWSPSAQNRRGAQRFVWLVAQALACEARGSGLASQRDSSPALTKVRPPATSSTGS